MLCVRSVKRGLVLHQTKRHTPAAVVQGLELTLSSRTCVRRATTEMTPNSRNFYPMSRRCCARRRSRCSLPWSLPSPLHRAFLFHTAPSMGCQQEHVSAHLVLLAPIVGDGKKRSTYPASLPDLSADTWLPGASPGLRTRRRSKSSSRLALETPSTPMLAWGTGGPCPLPQRHRRSSTFP